MADPGRRAGSAGYRRYDESTATALGDGAHLVSERYCGDLRRLRAAADGDPARVRELLVEFPRLGPVASDIFVREVQDVWPELRPALDARSLAGAERLGLPTDPVELAALVPAERIAEFAAGLVRVSLDRHLAERLGAAA